MLAPIYLLMLIARGSFGVYTIINSKPNNVTFRYLDGVNGESDLHLCQYNEVCNVVHDRFWMPNLIERLCRCPSGKECPFQWVTKTENSSMMLNNKSVLKFCRSTREMDMCKYKEKAAIVHGAGDRRNSYILPHNVTINCVCPQTHYWKLQKYRYEKDDVIVQEFKCAKQNTCQTLDFCGYIRSDLYSTYYKCTCPQKHLCVFQNRSQENVQELLYSGPAYKAYCYPYQ
ncbi:hypothetical protein KM043_007378 [Ampulex compressa]|nr:hypothetical protein KM043_007378 [Ampulex compressa]